VVEGFGYEMSQRELKVKSAVARARSSPHARGRASDDSDPAIPGSTGSVGGPWHDHETQMSKCFLAAHRWGHDRVNVAWVNLIPSHANLWMFVKWGQMQLPSLMTIFNGRSSSYLLNISEFIQ